MSDLSWIVTLLERRLGWRPSDEQVLGALTDWGQKNLDILADQFGEGDPFIPGMAVTVEDEADQFFGWHGQVDRFVRIEPAYTGLPRGDYLKISILDKSGKVWVPGRVYRPEQVIQKR